MSEQYNKLIATLQTIFEMDKADLDFGIYRIMNQKRDEINRFLEQDLLPQVKQAFADYSNDGNQGAQAELDKLIQTLSDAGMDPEQSPKVVELRQQLASVVDVTALENDVFSKLHTFFSRYYDKGDFISQRRYKADTYAIPYEGEEVKLYWANHDQYYIKSSEHLRDYAFLVNQGEDSEQAVRIKLVEADTEKDNVKAKQGEERRFVLDEENPLSIEEGELLVHFNYIPAGKKKQKDLNKAAVEAIFNIKDEAFADWMQKLGTPAPTEKDAKRTLLEKHLNDYTARNTFDYFIHKDLGGFLTRELDFYIKNEVMHLDDIDDAAFELTQQQLRKIKVLRTIAQKIIRMLAQIEDFQKKLWLKKKFVVETNYCITLDRVPESLYEEIASNELQIDEWVRLFSIDLIKEEKGDLASPDKPGYSTPLTVDFLKAYPSLVLDTVFFSDVFKETLLVAIDGLDEKCDGVLLHSENFQALNLMQNKHKGGVKCVYIDPPYNTSSSAIPYKNDYQHSSWGTMMRDRVQLLQGLMNKESAIFASIDKVERTILEYAMDNVFGRDNRVEELIWSMNTNNSQAPNYSTNHEYVLVYAKDRATAESDKSMFREPKPGFEEVMGLIAKLNPEYPTIEKIEKEIKKLYQQHKIELRNEADSQGLDWEVEKRNDPWKGLYNYNHAEYRDSNGRLVGENEANEKQAIIWVWQEADLSMPATKQAASTRDSNHKNWRFYTPLHPLTQKPAPHPKSGWKFAYDDDADSPGKRSFVSLDRDGRIAWGEDENKVPRIKRMLHEVETNVGKSVFADYSDGEKQTSALFGESGIFLAPKHADFVSRFVMHAAKKDSMIVDCFGGSGSTAHAVIKLNREDRGKRKFFLVEMGKHFDAVLKPRILKAVYASEWRLGKPISRDGLSQCVKYMRLESYEDALNNLQLKSSNNTSPLLNSHTALREDYHLGYWLDAETADSPSLLNIEQFEDPSNYTLNIGSGSVGATKPTKVDLVETFNYLIGLTVKTMDRIRGFKIVTGTNPKGESVLVVWRNINEQDNATLEAFLDKQGYNPRDTEFEHIYVNGDHTLEDPQSKVKMTEIEFKRLMFDVKDV